MYNTLGNSWLPVIDVVPRSKLSMTLPRRALPARRAFGAAGAAGGATGAERGAAAGVAHVHGGLEIGDVAERRARTRAGAGSARFAGASRSAPAPSRLPRRAALPIRYLISFPTLHRYSRCILRYAEPAAQIDDPAPDRGVGLRKRLLILLVVLERFGLAVQV